MLSQNTLPPNLSMGDVLWARLHRSGWHLTHSSVTDNDTGHLRHLLTARRGDTELICSAPTMTLALETMHRASQNAEAPTRGQETNQ